MKTEQLTLEYLEQMTDPTKFKSFKVKVHGNIKRIKLSKIRIFKVTKVEYSKFYKHYSLRIGENSYSARWFYKVVDQPDHSVTDQFQPEPIHPDNQTVATLIQYVSEHKDSMSKDSIRHFANLIGLIKLGAL